MWPLILVLRAFGVDPKIVIGRGIFHDLTKKNTVYIKQSYSYLHAFCHFRTLQECEVAKKQTETIYNVN